jgi:hypothetical protein
VAVFRGCAQIGAEMAKAVGLVKFTLALVLIPSTLVLAGFYMGFWGVVLWAVVLLAWWFRIGPFNGH